MFSVTIDNKKIDLIPYPEALAQTGLVQSDLGSFGSEHEPTHSIWSESTFTQTLVDKLVRSILPHMPIDDYPQLPDQFAILLRNELTLVSDRFPLSADEKDLFEQRLQNALRPVIYEAVQAKLSGDQSDRPLPKIEQILSETTALGWQQISAGDWSIYEIESAVGLVGYFFSRRDQKIAAQYAMNNEQQFLLDLASKVLGILLQK